MLSRRYRASKDDDEGFDDDDDDDDDDDELLPPELPWSNEEFGACIQRLSVDRMSSAISSRSTASAPLFCRWPAAKALLAASSRRSSTQGRTRCRKKSFTPESRSSDSLSAKAWGLRCPASTRRRCKRSPDRMAPSSRSRHDRRCAVFSRTSCRTRCCCCC